jgi:hypothetical protein
MPQQVPHICHYCRIHHGSITRRTRSAHPRNPGIQLFPQFPAVRLTLSKTTERRQSVREKTRNTIVDDQPRVCFRQPFSRFHGTHWQFAAKSSRPMTIGGSGGGDRNMLRVPVLADGLRDWSFGVFNCFSDLPTCKLCTTTTCLHLQYHNSLCDFRPPVNVLLLLCLRSEQAAICPP